MRNDQAYLSHILQSIETIQRYMKGVDYASFKKQEMMIDAIIRQLEIIGEAASHVSGELKSQHDTLPWRQMQNMRNLLIHHYFGVDIEVVWDTCKKDLPSLKKAIELFL